MATYRDIQAFVKERYGIDAQSAWIAHVKELNGLPVKSRRTSIRIKSCPEQWRAAIEEAMRHFGWLHAVAVGAADEAGAARAP
ncbi:hypothetical protein [Burkholderia plantarii]|uniref:hypothetical protein n=1 Tax=Burkholderia plantarii TaxID=41899 RepID=UPI0006D8CB92|nr:hypothetical protein [Burkholderia plantarii]GLZ23004.1 hypothetical protein Bpla01_65330 [Burkholderia plantarii]